ncbi:uncharacterized protein [Gossypium hirsutum]|uniref:Retrotransposon gag domain-containing protein n=1 Tax=Gossypium hirsutum TaxID=3635 RepID=A0A1U8PGE2_GOSHI|nr:uncharacterized protein LOC107941998 [Gossypium hirsutum]
MNFEIPNQNPGRTFAYNTHNPITVADDRNCAIQQYLIPLFNELNPSISRPEIEVQQFKMKSVIFQMLQNMGQFSGIPTKDPHLYLRLFMEVSDSFKLVGVVEDALRLRLFPYFLRDRALAWLNSLPSGSITTWQELVECFLMKYFPPSLITMIRNEFTSFQQLDKESLYEAWEQFKELLRKCPHHSIPCCVQMETFYIGLNIHTRMMVDASANGALFSKSYKNAYKIIERIASNNYQWPTNRAASKRRAVGVHKADTLASLAAQVSSMSSMLKNITFNGFNGNLTGQQLNQFENISCEYCGDGHFFENCPLNQDSNYYMGNQNWNDPQSNFYNSSWKNYPISA